MTKQKQIEQLKDALCVCLGYLEQDKAPEEILHQVRRALLNAGAEIEGLKEQVESYEKEKSDQ